ncbi:hypothetical protein EMIT043CA1_150072 [Pseudomonas brassicacearum]
MAGNYGHGDIVASHRHAEGQLVYAINGVMPVSVAGTTWVVPSDHTLGLETRRGGSRRGRVLVWHKKRRPWTSLDDEVVGRGNLNRIGSTLILKVIIDFNL